MIRSGLPKKFWYSQCSAICSANNSWDWSKLLLPQWYLLEGAVQRGHGRGSKSLGFPTANLPQFEAFLDKFHIINGVYWGWAVIEGENKLTGCVSSIGVSPTFVGQENPCRIIETYVYDRDKNAPDFYEKKLRVLLTGFLRPEIKYDSITALIEQINEDVNFGRILSEKIATGLSPNDTAKLTDACALATKPFVQSDSKEKVSWQVITWKELPYSNK